MIADSDTIPAELHATALEAMLQQVPDIPALCRTLEEEQTWALIETAFDLPAATIQARHKLTPTQYRKLCTKYNVTIARIREVREKILSMMITDALYPAIAYLWQSLQTLLIKGLSSTEGPTARGLRDIASICKTLVDINLAMGFSPGGVLAGTDSSPYPTPPKRPTRRARADLDRAISSIEA